LDEFIKEGLNLYEYLKYRNTLVDSKNIDGTIADEIDFKLYDFQE
jgi:hypothetical protein